MLKLLLCKKKTADKQRKPDESISAAINRGGVLLTNRQLTCPHNMALFLTSTPAQVQELSRRLFSFLLDLSSEGFEDRKLCFY